MVEKSDSVDLEIEIRSGTILGLVEETVSDNFGIRSVSFVGINVSHVGIKSIAAYGEGIGCEYLEGACFKFLLSCFDSFYSTCSCYSFVNFGKSYRTFCNTAAPVSRDSFAVLNSLDDEFEVGLPIDTGRYDEGVGASCKSAAVVGNVGNTCGLTSGRSTHGVCVLAYELAVVA